MNLLYKFCKKRLYTPRCSKLDSDADVRRTEALEDDAGSATEGRNLVRPSVVPSNEVEASGLNLPYYTYTIHENNQHIIFVVYFYRRL